jgi:hypothetical protein
MNASIEAVEEFISKMRSEVIIIVAEKARRIIIEEDSKVVLGEALASSISTYELLGKEMFPFEQEKLANVCLRYINLAYTSGVIVYNKERPRSNS